MRDPRCGVKRWFVVGSAFRGEQRAATESACCVLRLRDLLRLLEKGSPKEAVVLLGHEIAWSPPRCRHAQGAGW